MCTMACREVMTLGRKSLVVEAQEEGMDGWMVRTVVCLLAGRAGDLVCDRMAARFSVP